MAKRKSDVRSVKIPEEAWEKATKLAEGYTPKTTRPNLLTMLVLQGLERVEKYQSEHKSQ